MNENEKRQRGKLFAPGDPELVAEKLRAHKLNIDFNRLFEDQTAEREDILHRLLGHLGSGSFIQGPITFHYGSHCSIGDNCFINFNFTVQDDAAVTIGDNCNFGPNVTIVTPQHPLLPDERRTLPCPDGRQRHLCYAQPVHIGHDCWLGANVVVCPGVSIGDNCVIGAGSVVTRDIPADCVAVGNPCRVIRRISEEDSIYRHPELL